MSSKRLRDKGRKALTPPADRRAALSDPLPGIRLDHLYSVPDEIHGIRMEQSRQISVVTKGSPSDGDSCDPA